MHVLNRGLWHHWGWLTVALGMAWSIPTLLMAWAGSPWPSLNHSTLCPGKTSKCNMSFPTDGANWYYTGSVGWMLRLRWATSGGGRPVKWIQNQKGGQSEPTKHPPMAKLISQRWNSNLFQELSVQEISYRCVVQTGPLYRELGVVISSVTSPRFTEAREFGHNLLNG